MAGLPLDLCLYILQYFSVIKAMPLNKSEKLCDLGCQTQFRLRCNTSHFIF